MMLRYPLLWSVLLLALSVCLADAGITERVSVGYDGQEANCTTERKP